MKIEFSLRRHIRFEKRVSVLKLCLIWLQRCLNIAHPCFVTRPRIFCCMGYYPCGHPLTIIMTSMLLSVGLTFFEKCIEVFNAACEPLNSVPSWKPWFRVGVERHRFIRQATTEKIHGLGHAGVGRMSNAVECSCGMLMLN